MNLVVFPDVSPELFNLVESRWFGHINPFLAQFTVKFFGILLKGLILRNEFSSFLKSSDSLRLCLDLLF